MVRIILLKDGFPEKAVQIGETQSQSYQNPVYNQRFQFNAQQKDIIKIQVVDPGAKIETLIEMSKLREYMEDKNLEIKELWYNFGN